jgi:hypothetical protein
MANAAFVRTVIAMTTYLPPLSITAAPQVDSRRAHPARWLHRQRDGKLELLAGVESLATCGSRDLVALAAAADLIDVPEGTVLGAGASLGQYWWMPVDGWLLVSGSGKQAITIPTGWSWAGPSRPIPADTQLTALRGGRVLTATTGALFGALEARPRLAAAVRSTLVVPQ